MFYIEKFVIQYLSYNKDIYYILFEKLNLINYLKSNNSYYYYYINMFIIYIIEIIHEY